MLTVILCLIALWIALWAVWLFFASAVAIAETVRQLSRSDLALLCSVLFVALCVYTATGWKSWAFLAGLFVAVPCLILATKRGDTAPSAAKQPQRRINRV